MNTKQSILTEEVTATYKKFKQEQIKKAIIAIVVKTNKKYYGKT